METSSVPSSALRRRSARIRTTKAVILLPLLALLGCRQSVLGRPRPAPAASPAEGVSAPSMSSLAATPPSGRRRPAPFSPERHCSELRVITDQIGDDFSRLYDAASCEQRTEAEKNKEPDCAGVFVPSGFMACKCIDRRGSKTPAIGYSCTVETETPAQAEALLAQIQTAWATCFRPPWRRTNNYGLHWMFGRPKRVARSCEAGQVFGTPSVVELNCGEYMLD